MTGPHERLGKPDTGPMPERLRIPTEWIVITGAPSSGKTTIVNRLQRHLQGFTVVPEITRGFVESDIAKGIRPDMTEEYNDGLNRRVSAKRSSIEAALDVSTPTIMDRGTYDTRTYARYYRVEEEYITTDRQYKAVFLMDPLPLKADGVRYEDPDFIAEIDTLLSDVYTEQGYQPIRVPQFPYDEPTDKTEVELEEASIEQRTRFILEHIK